eukprot:NODE_14065_length_171_cov_137.663934_g12905_i0.p3 GENE.NODE_14065_length_171_cov_137.663934_g12905_i0~~NODE_14065_length_171_cov_137.663934_g12905_i0.p3  ORF type:complete len:53 (+),score=29.48 NODE_14065_length_171_cov_137.663934_g12905_i0:32-160(+)
MGDTQTFVTLQADCIRCGGIDLRLGAAETHKLRQHGIRIKPP